MVCNISTPLISICALYFYYFVLIYFNFFKLNEKLLEKHNEIKLSQDQEPSSGEDEQGIEFVL